MGPETPRAAPGALPRLGMPLPAIGIDASDCGTALASTFGVNSTPNRAPGVCPVPLGRYPTVTLAHGDGGRLTNALIRDLFHAAWQNPHLDRSHDGAVFDVPAGRLAFTTDSYVVRPLFFPGGDIGRLAVHGTVNDLAMCGARPQYLSVGFVLEEGLSMEVLWSVVCSMAEAASASGVSIVTGDTKVVERGKADGVFINTAGVGTVVASREIHPGAVRDGDLVLLSGDPGRHGLAVLAAREGLSFDRPVESDAASVATPVLHLLAAGVDVRCLRDITRGGLATGLVEIAETAGRSIEIEEAKIRLDPTVRGGSELLGLDPLYLASEGRFVAIVAESDADRALAILREQDVSRHACSVGRVLADDRAQVVLRTAFGTDRILDRLAGATVPRIC